MSSRGVVEPQSREDGLKKVKLREVAHSRSGEKGRDSTISVIAYDEADYDLIEREITVAAVAEVFGSITHGAIHRYEVPRIGALNFVFGDILEGGRTRTLAFDESGKALSSLMMGLEIEVPSDYVCRSERVSDGCGKGEGV